jgi:hypothetical protein
LTGAQKLRIAGLMVLQVLTSIVFYPIAALFALTGIGVPVAMVFMGIGTAPYSFAMRLKGAWQSVGRPEAEHHQRTDVVATT